MSEYHKNISKAAYRCRLDSTLRLAKPPAQLHPALKEFFTNPISGGGKQMTRTDSRHGDEQLPDKGRDVTPTGTAISFVKREPGEDTARKCQGEREE